MLTALWLMFPKFRNTHGGFLRISILVTTISILSLLGLAVLAERMHIESDGTGRSRAVIGMRIASTLAKAMGAQGDDVETSQTQPTKHGLRMTGGAVYLTKPALRQPLAERIKQAGGRVVESPNLADATLDWSSKEGWVVGVTHDPQRAAALYLLVADLLDEKANEQVYEEKRLRTLAGMRSTETEHRNKRAVYILVRTGMAALALFFPLVILTYVAISSAGIGMEQRRKGGELEPLATTKTPLWAFVLAEAAGRATIACGLSALIIGGAAAFLGIRSWWSIGLFCTSQFAVILAISLMTSLQSIWFRHPVGRVIAGMTLNFTSYPMVPLLFLATSFGAKDIASAGESWIKMYEQQRLPVLDWSLGQSLTGIAIMVPTALAIGMVSARLMSWRVRKHRYRLAQ
jgi:hypothetical protein